MVFFSIATLSYLPRLDVLSRSLAEHHHGARLVVALVDRIAGRIDSSRYPLLDMREIETLGIPRIAERIARYRVMELATSVKAVVFQMLLAENAAESTFVYLDPDIRVYAPLDDAQRDLGGGTALLTPNILTPDAGTRMPDERLFLRAGIFNLGFMALRRCAEADRLLAWWEERLETRSMYKPKEGFFGDQLWMNHAPIFFSEVRAWHHMGANAGWRNLHERTYSRSGDRWMVNGNVPLLFYHFSRLPPVEAGEIAAGMPRFTFENRPDLVPLYAEYRRELEEAGEVQLGKLPCLLPNLRPHRPGEETKSGVHRQLAHRVRSMLGGKAGP